MKKKLENMEIAVAKSIATNPLADLIDDATYDLLIKEDLLSLNGIRNYEIRREFKEHRENTKMSVGDIIDKVAEKYFMQFDTVKKIVYKVKK